MKIHEVADRLKHFQETVNAIFPQEGSGNTDSDARYAQQRKLTGQVSALSFAAHERLQEAVQAIKNYDLYAWRQLDAAQLDAFKRALLHAWDAGTEVLNEVHKITERSVAVTVIQMRADEAAEFGDGASAGGVDDSSPLVGECGCSPQPTWGEARQDQHEAAAHGEAATP